MKSIRLQDCIAALLFLAIPAQAGSPTAEAAARDALQAGQAVCKIISPTDAGSTGSHQAGLYLPKSAWRFFTNSPPAEEENHDGPATLTWPDGSTTSASLR